VPAGAVHREQGTLSGTGFEAPFRRPPAVKAGYISLKRGGGILIAIMSDSR